MSPLAWEFPFRSLVSLHNSTVFTQLISLHILFFMHQFLLAIKLFQSELSIKLIFRRLLTFVYIVIYALRLTTYMCTCICCALLCPYDIFYWIHFDHGDNPTHRQCEFGSLIGGIIQVWEFVYVIISYM